MPLMITFAQIQSVSDEIARRFRPDEIILFGSYAYGTPIEYSDVDLLVVKLRSAVYAGFAMDLIPITVAAPKTHDLGKLLDLLLPMHPLWAF